MPTSSRLCPRAPRGLLACSLLAATLAWPCAAFAVRPFVTDDARVVGGRSAQLETWLRFDRGSAQHWLLGGFGPAGPIELTVGFAHGVVWEQPGATHYSLAAPLLQAKGLLWEPRPNGLPGVAIAGGCVGPIGTGDLATNGWDFFEYVAITESLFDRDRLLVHLNLGVFGSTDPRHGGVAFTWGAGAQLRLFGGMNAVAEIYSGDPYLGGGGGAMQLGFRYIFSPNVQIDSTFGAGLWGAHVPHPWGTVGLRLASNPLW